MPPPTSIKLEVPPASPTLLLVVPPAVILLLRITSMVMEAAGAHLVRVLSRVASSRPLIPVLQPTSMAIRAPAATATMVVSIDPPGKFIMIMQVMEDCKR